MAHGSASCLLVAASCLLASAARAHAPEPRGVALTSDAGRIAVALPGFGLLVRSAPTAPFVYVCDALLSTPPSDVVTPLAYVADGSLLLGTIAGLRVLDADGCPRSDVSALQDTPVFALAISPSRPAIAYAATAGSQPGLWRSADAGQHWELRSPLVSAQRVSALRVGPDDPDVLYMSQGIPEGRSTLRVSRDGGESFTNHEQERALTLLHVSSGTPARLWVVGRDAQSVGNRGFALSRADAPEGPWSSALRVNYFGGFDVDARGVISVGDESGGLYSSRDGGDTFRTVSADGAVACLTHAGDALWACNIGIATQPALNRLVEPTDSLTGVVSFADVQQLVSCAPELAVERRCATAWVEWQRDVLMRPSTSPDAGQTLDTDVSIRDAGRLDASSPSAPVLPGADAALPLASDDASALPARARHGCALDRSQRGSPVAAWPAVWLSLLSCALFVRARRARANGARTRA